MKTNQTSHSKLIIFTVAAVVTILVISFIYLRFNSSNQKQTNGKDISLQPVSSLGKQVVDTTLSCDLDGNGVEETILYTLSGKLYINDIEYSEHVGILEESNPLYDGFYLMDIDSNDSYKEIALCSYGRSDDLSTFLYYYKENKLIPMGLLEGLPDNELAMRAIIKESEGVLKAPIRLSILQTWWGYQSYELKEDHQISPVHQDYYEPTIPYNSPLIQPLVLYTTAELTADTLEISKGDVQFISTDNNQWCKVKTQNGEEGWFYIENGLINGVNEPTEVFQNLALYD